MGDRCLTDVHEIQQLIYRYAHTFDTGHLQAFAALFDRGTLHLEGVGPPVTGADEVTALLDRRVIFYDGSPRTNHLIHNSLIEVDPDRTSARASSYAQVLQAIPGRGVEVIVTGIYHDELRRDAAGWYFRHRRAVGSLLGDVSHHLRARSGVTSGTVS